MDQRTIMGENCSAVVIDDPLVSIDTLDDFDVVERRMCSAFASHQCFE